jgi:hypothetical protein
MSWLVAAVVFSSVQVEVPATVAPLGRLLPTLGKRLGIELAADPSVRDDVMGMVIPPSTSTGAVLSGIAEAANASWDLRDNRRVLVRTRKQQEADEAEDADMRAAWIRRVISKTPTESAFTDASAAALADYRFEYKSNAARSQPSFAQLDVMNARSPLGRFTRRLIEAMGARELASLPQGQRLVFSTRPTRVQRPLPLKNLDSLLSTFRAEQNRYAKAVEAKGEPGMQGQFVSGFDFVQPIPNTPSKINLVIDNRNPYQWFILLSFHDSRGITTLSTRGSLTRDAFETPPVIDPKSPRIPLSESSLLRLKVSRTTEVISDHERKPFQDLVANEPLEFVHADALRAWSSVAKKPIFALLPDSAIGWSSGNSNITISSYRATLSRSTSISEERNRIILRPLEPASARLTRANRAALTAYIRECLKAGRSTLAAQMNLARATRSGFGNSGDWFLRLALPPMHPSLDSLMVLKLIALGPQSQRQALLEGQSLSLGDLTREQITLAHDLVFKYGVVSSFIMPLMTTDMRMNRGPSEITEALPNGLPANFQVAAPLKSETGFVAREAGSEPLFMTDRSVALYVAGGTKVPGKELRAATQESLNMRLTAPGIFIGHRSFVEHVFDPRAPWGPYNTQPSAARARVSEIAEEIKRQRGRGGDLR